MVLTILQTREAKHPKAPSSENLDVFLPQFHSIVAEANAHGFGSANDASSSDHHQEDTQAAPSVTPPLSSALAPLHDTVDLHEVSAESLSHLHHMSQHDEEPDLHRVATLSDGLMWNGDLFDTVLAEMTSAVACEVHLEAYVRGTSPFLTFSCIAEPQCRFKEQYSISTILWTQSLVQKSGLYSQSCL